MNRHNLWNRRDLLRAAGASVAVPAAVAALAAQLRADEPPKINGHVNQSVCQWCYRLPLDKLAAEAKKIGYKSVELLTPEQYLQIKPLGLTCAMLKGTGPIHNCLNRTENHERCEKELRAAIEFAAAEGLPNVICFSGNRKGMPDDEGLKTC